jgi:hypothetical protein
MKTYKGKITFAAIVLLMVVVAAWVGYLAPKAYAALTANPVLVMTNTKLDNYTYNYVILFDKKTGYPLTASTGTPKTDETWANAGLFFTQHATFIKWDLKLPTSLKPGTYIAQNWGSTNSTADSADTYIGLDFEFDWSGTKVTDVRY